MDEDRFEGDATRAVLVHFGRARVEVVLERGPVFHARAERGGVPVAVAPPDEPLVVPWELLAPVVEDLFVHAPGGGIDRPPHEARCPFVRAVAVGVEHLRMTHDVAHDPTVGEVVRIHRVVHEAEVDLAPPRGIATGRVAGEEPDACAVVRVPRVRQRGHPAHRGIEIERHGQIEDDDLGLGDRAVVQHRLAGHRDVDGTAHLAVGADDDVLHVVPLPVVDDRVQLSRARVALRVRSERTGQRAAEVGHLHRVEVVGQLDREAAGLDDRQRAAGVADHVRVGGAAAHAVARPGRRRPPLRRGDVVVPHEPVAIPLGLAVTHADAVHHAGAREPVVRLRIRRRHRVRSDAQQPAVELLGDPPAHGQIGDVELVVDGCEVAGQVRARRDARFGCGHRDSFSA